SRRRLACPGESARVDSSARPETRVVSQCGRGPGCHCRGRLDRNVRVDQSRSWPADDSLLVYMHIWPFLPGPAGPTSLMRSSTSCALNLLPPWTTMTVPRAHPADLDTCVSQIRAEYQRAQRSRPSCNTSGNALRRSGL